MVLGQQEVGLLYIDQLRHIFIAYNIVLMTNKTLNIKILIFSNLLVLIYVLGAQKNRLIETVLLSTHNICFG